VVLLSSCVAAWTALFACTSSDDENPATTRNRDVDSGQEGTGSVDPDGSPAAPTGDPLCGKYGGIDGVKAIASQIITNAMGDCRISPIVTRAAGGGSNAHLMDCFSSFLGGGFQCPGVSYSQNETTDSQGKRCESILPGLKFGDEDWKAFGDFNADPPSAAKAALTAKQASLDDLTQVATMFVGKKATLINNDQIKGKFTVCAANCSSGGDACIPPIIDAGQDTGIPDTGTTDTPDTGVSDAGPG
jgi:hypothetical protein